MQNSKKKTKLTHWVRLVVYLARNGKLMRPRYISWNNCQTLTMTLKSYSPKASLKIPFIVGAWCPCSRYFHWKRNDFLKLELVNFYMNYNLTKNVTKIKKILNDFFFASVFVASKTVHHRCFCKKVFCKYAANLQENTHAEVPYRQRCIANTLKWHCCIGAPL